MGVSIGLPGASRLTQRTQFRKAAGRPVRRLFPRINIHHRLVYRVLSEINTVEILRMGTHYE
jgi:Txe/YoeB family toxin of Txe-Axe toxin-antitoxin module